MVKLFLLSLLFICTTAHTQESYFFTTKSDSDPPRIIIKGEQLITTTAIKIIAPPKASAIHVYYQGYGEGRDYQISITLKQKCVKNWYPMFKLDDDVFCTGVSVKRSQEAQLADSFAIEGSDLKKIHQWVASLARLLHIPREHVFIDLEKTK